MGVFRKGKVTFPSKEAKELFQLRHLLNDYEYLFKENKDKLSSGDREIFKTLNKELNKLIQNKKL